MLLPISVRAMTSESSYGLTSYVLDLARDGNYGNMNRKLITDLLQIKTG